METRVSSTNGDPRSRIQVFNPQRLGALISFGGEHLVFRYAENRVAKRPFGPRWLTNRASYCALQQRCLELMKTHFAGFFLETELLRFENSYWILQPYLDDLRRATTAELHTDELNIQLRELWRRNSQLIADHHLCYDFLGAKGLLTNRLENIALVESRLFLYDLGILDLDDPSPLWRRVSRYAAQRQRRLIERLL